MYSHQIVPPGQIVEPAAPRAERHVWERTGWLLAAAGALIAAAAVVLALTLSGSSHSRTVHHAAPAATHSAAPAATSLPRFTAPLIPKGYYRDPTTHELIQIHAAQSLPRFTAPLIPKGYYRDPTTHELIPIH
jgi:hypothetical protein